jgi:hypothetical protein
MSDARHLAWIRQQQCCVPACDRRQPQHVIEAAHIRRSFNSGTGMKPADRFCVPLCFEHHAESHQGERTFERKYGIDLLALAAQYDLGSGSDLI